MKRKMLIIKGIFGVVARRIPMAISDLISLVSFTTDLVLSRFEPFDQGIED